MNLALCADNSGSICTSIHVQFSEKSPFQEEIEYFTARL